VLQKKVLRGRKPLTHRPGVTLPPADFDAIRADLEKKLGRKPTDRDVNSHLMYPKVFADFVEHLRKFSDTSILPTRTFFYGMEPGEEVSVDIEPGKTLIIKLLSIGDVEPDGARVLTFELNGQPRTMRVADESARVSGPKRRKVTPGRPGEVGAPMPGRVIDLVTKVGEKLTAGQKLLVTEAMKLETVVKAPISGLVREIVAGTGESVEAGDLLVVIEEVVAT
jgi:pyruvate carboxylase